MAFGLTVPDTRADGVISNAYARIVLAKFDFLNLTGAVQLYVYRSEAARQAGKQAACNVGIEIPKEPRPADEESGRPAQQSFTELLQANAAPYTNARTAIYDFADTHKHQARYVSNGELSNEVVQGISASSAGLDVQVPDPEDVGTITGFSRVAQLNCDFAAMKARAAFVTWLSEASFNAGNNPIPGVVGELVFTESGVPEEVDPSTQEVLTPAVPSFTEFVVANMQTYNELRASLYDYCRPILAADDRFDNIVDIV